MVDTLSESLIQQKNSVLVVDHEHDDVRYMYEDLSERTSVPLILLILPVYNDDGTCAPTFQDWNEVCARENIELIITCICNEDVDNVVSILTNNTIEADIK